MLADLRCKHGWHIQRGTPRVILRSPPSVERVDWQLVQNLVSTTISYELVHDTAA
jgi:hypothetical protein